MQLGTPRLLCLRSNRVKLVCKVGFDSQSALNQNWRQFQGLHSAAAICSRNYYEVLGVKPTATHKEIRDKYMELCKKYHPDSMAHKTAAERDLGTKQFQAVNEAYTALSKTSTRKSYDANEEFVKKHGMRRNEYDWKQESPYYGHYYQREQDWYEGYYEAKRKRMEEEMERMSGRRNPFGFRTSSTHSGAGQRWTYTQHGSPRYRTNDPDDHYGAKGYTGQTNGNIALRIVLLTIALVMLHSMLFGAADKRMRQLEYEMSRNAAMQHMEARKKALLAEKMDTDEFMRRLEESQVK